MNTTLHNPPLYADFWKGYKFDEDLIKSVPASSLLNNSAFYPPPNNNVYCKDGVLGCKNHCSKTVACEEREAKGGECLVVAMMVYYFDPGYLQAAMNNIGIPTYFCFIGFGGMQNFALDAHNKGRPVLFYHYEPDLFHIKHPASSSAFIFLDLSPNGLSQPRVYLEDASPISQLVSKFSIAELHMNDLLRKYRDNSADSSVVDPTFTAACAWVKENYNEWTKWLDRAPLCQFDVHVQYSLSGCESENVTDSMRTVDFAWKNPNPDNTTLPYDCDGGLLSLPPQLQTSRSCAWITSDPSRWRSWIYNKPTCDSTFYKYNITRCDTNAKRTVKYWWLIPDPTDSSKSLECAGGEVLPSDVLVDCDYMPTHAPGFFAVLVIALIIIGLLAISTLVVIR